MRNYRTTLVGAALAGLSFLAIYQQNGGDLSDWKQWLIPAAIAGTMKLLIACLCLLSVPSCTSDAAGNKAFLGLTTVQWIGVGQDAAKAAAQGGFGGYTQRRAVTAAKQPVNVQP